MIRRQSKELTAIRDRVRYYGRDDGTLTGNGGSTTAAYRVIKRLEDGEWQRSFVRDDAPST